MGGNEKKEIDWEVIAFESQSQFFETLGSRPYDEIEKSNLFLMKKKVGFATCGKPSELPTCANYNTGYNTEQLEYIKSICEKIIEKSDYDPVRFACTILILHHKEVVCETPVFRIVTSTGNIFIDANARVYQSWENFMKNNKLPKCEYCYPVNGEYNKEKGLLLSFANSPASNLLNQTTECLDTAGSFASIAAASVFAAGFFVTVGPAVAAVAGTSAACAGVYNITRSVSSLCDRNKHEQSIGLSDRESRSAWMSIGSSALGVTTMTALGKAKNIYESGESLSKLGIYGLHALTASSVLFSGFGFVDTFITCVDKYNKGILTKLDVFDLSCELLFLFNAIASAKATTKLINNISAVAGETSAGQRKLTKTQKRNLRRRAAKRRSKGLSVNLAEDSNQTSGTGISTAMKLVIYEALKAFVPRVEEILFKYHSIGHDIMCWRQNEISILTLMCNMARKLPPLYNDYIDEVTDTIKKIEKYFKSITFNKVIGDIYKLFEHCSEELKAIFCTKVINMEDQVELLINNAEREIIDLQEHLGVENIDNLSESNSEDNEISDDDLNPETQNILTGCGNVIVASSWSCTDLEEFGDILDGVKYVVVSEFKGKVNNYKKSLEAAKSASGDSFDINAFHRALEIKGDVGQHMFNESLKELTAASIIYKIKSKCKDIEKERTARTVPVWEALTEGMFHYYGQYGTGPLQKNDILSLVSNVVKISITEESCTFFEHEDVTMIKINDEDIQILFYCGITAENTATGIIMIVK